MTVPYNVAYGFLFTNVFFIQLYVEKARDKIFKYTVSLPSLPSIRNSIPLCQKVDSRILRENTESLLTVYSGILTKCLVYGWYTLEYSTKGTESLPTVYSGILTECLVYGWYILKYFHKKC